MNKEELRQYSAKLMADKEELQERIDKAIEYIENMTKQFESFKDKELITNRVIDISVLEKILKILDKGE